MKTRNLLLLYFFCFSLIDCVDPVTPEFDFQEGLIFVEAFATNTRGTSFVSLNESVFLGSRYTNVFISNAEVNFINSNTGETIRLLEQDDVYVPPDDFIVSVGDSWELDILLSDGRQYKSLPETVLTPVEISSIKSEYSPQLDFRDDSESFVPGHVISVTFEDPLDVDNFYYWRFRSFERIADCVTCRNSVYRNGICEAPDTDVFIAPYYTYTCESLCWQLRFNDNIKIFDDEFSNGTLINELPIADVFLYTNQDILVEIEQFSLTESAYEYYKVLKDIIDNNSGFNAPPPAALIGNMFNPVDDNEFVLGRFTAAATTTTSVFIDRSVILEQTIDVNLLSQPESTPPIDPREIITTGPCIESRFRTSIQPAGWQTK